MNNITRFSLLAILAVLCACGSKEDSSHYKLVLVFQEGVDGNTLISRIRASDAISLSPKKSVSSELHIKNDTVIIKFDLSENHDFDEVFSSVLKSITLSDLKDELLKISIEKNK